MIEYLNNPALLILACEVMLFLLVVNFILLFLVSKKNSKAVKALNVLVADIKSKSEENKKKMAELLLQPGITDPELIKQGMQGLVNGQTQFYKNMIKAIRTQSVDDVASLGESVTSLIGSAINLGRESGVSTANKEAEETQARLESEKQDLTDSNNELENKLENTAKEMEVLMGEYKSMMNNANKDKAKNDTTESSEPDQEQASEEIIDITAGDSEDELIDIASEIEESNTTDTDTEAEEKDKDETASEEKLEVAIDESAEETDNSADLVDEILDIATDEADTEPEEKDKSEEAA